MCLPDCASRRTAGQPASAARRERCAAGECEVGLVWSASHVASDNATFHTARSDGPPCPLKTALNRQLGPLERPEDRVILWQRAQADAADLPPDARAAYLAGVLGLHGSDVVTAIRARRWLRHGRPAGWSWRG